MLAPAISPALLQAVPGRERQKQMAAKIRLARVGGHKNPYYRIVVADESRARDGKFLEILGTFHPVHKGKEIETRIHTERLEFWLKAGARPSETVAQVLARHKKASAAAK